MTTRRKGRLSAALLLLTPALLAGLAAAAQSAPPPSSPQLTKFTEQLPTPPLLDHRDGAPLTLDEVVTSHRFHTQLQPTPTFAYTPPGVGNTFLGPTIEVERGTELQLTVANKLGDGTEVVHPFAAFFDPTLPGQQQPDDAKAVATAAHLHGGHTQPDFDGGPDDTYLPELAASASEYLEEKAARDHDVDDDGAFTYVYANDQEATGLWIHDHSLGATRLNPKAGLALSYWIRDDVDTGDPDNPLGLPTDGNELPIVLQDGSFNADGTFDYPVATTEYHPIWAPEAFGDVAIVNGKAWPNKDVDRGVYRLRLVNGSNARVYRLTLVDSKDKPSGIPIYQIGGDGGLLNSPVAVPGGAVVIAPGERADLLVDFRNARPGKYRWNNNAPTPFPSGPRSARLGGPGLNQIMQFTVGSTPGHATLPTQLRGIDEDGTSPILAPAAATGAETARTVMLNEIIDPVTGVPVEALLNNLPFHGNHGTDAQHLVGLPDVDTTEVWSLVNTTGDTHPIHLHLTQFRVLDRQPFDVARYLTDVSAAIQAANPDKVVLPLPDPSARRLGTGFEGSEDGVDEIAIAPDPTPYLLKRRAPAGANETGWKDTVMANPGEVLRILVPFGGTDAGVTAPYSGSFTGQYVWHCHILEHEENDMMMSYRVVR
jgi:FtsP/CotA-like multicopper oxidase with cupredoxin domain